jgi:hypothetical protein
MTYKVLFDSDCVYKTKDLKNQKDINKLFGLSFGFHHNNSVRFGWRSTDNGRIDILAYVYRDGERITEQNEGIYIETIDVNVTYVMEIYVSKDKYMFTITRGSKLVGANIIKHEKLPSLGYYLNPYFGGDETAPHDMVIELCKMV